MSDLYEPGAFDGWETNGDGTIIHHHGRVARCPNCGDPVPSAVGHACGGLPVAAVGDPILYRLTAQDMMHLGDIASRSSSVLIAAAGDCVAGVVVGGNPTPPASYNLLLFLDGTIGPRRVAHRTIGDRPGEFRVRA